MTCAEVSPDVINYHVHYVAIADHTSLLWEMEQRQKQDHHQLLKQQLREAFHMQRHQMHIRHQMVRDSNILLCRVTGVWSALCRKWICKVGVISSSWKN